MVTFMLLHDYDHLHIFGQTTLIWFNWCNGSNTFSVININLKQWGTPPYLSFPLWLLRWMIPGKLVWPVGCDCFLAGIGRVFASLNTFGSMQLRWHTVDNNCLNKYAVCSTTTKVIGWNICINLHVLEIPHSKLSRDLIDVADHILLKSKC